MTRFHTTFNRSKREQTKLDSKNKNKVVDICRRLHREHKGLHLENDIMKISQHGRHAWIWIVKESWSGEAPELTGRDRGVQALCGSNLSSMTTGLFQRVEILSGLQLKFIEMMNFQFQLKKT